MISTPGPSPGPSPSPSPSTSKRNSLALTPRERKLIISLHCLFLTSDFRVSL
jgi:hypothetical protein